MNPASLPSLPSVKNPGPDSPSVSSALIYGRLSKGDDALASHEQRNVDYCRFQQFNVLDTFSDPDTSGAVPLLDREGGRALFAALRSSSVSSSSLSSFASPSVSGRPGHLIVAKLDRLGRNAIDVLGTLKLLDDLGVTLHIVDMGGMTITTQGHFGKLILHIFVGIAEWELNEIRTRTAKRAAHKFSAGQLIGTVPYGYDCRYTFADNHNTLRPIAMSGAELALELNEHGACLSKLLEDNLQEQTSIKLIHAWRNDDRLGYKAIATRLNMAGVRTKGGADWQCGHIRRLLESKHTRRLLSSPERGIYPASPSAETLKAAA